MKPNLYDDLTTSYAIMQIPSRNECANIFKTRYDLAVFRL